MITFIVVFFIICLIAPIAFKILIHILKNRTYEIEFTLDDVIVIDTETTGLTGRDEVLQLSIVNGEGKTLFDEYVKPIKKKTWGPAEKIHGISRDHVANCNNLIYYQKELEEIFKNYKVVAGYNIAFDIRMLKQSGLNESSKIFSMPTYDVMMTYKKSRHLGPFPKLCDCAQALGYQWDDSLAHGSLYDAKATLYCLEKLMEEGL